MAQFIGTQVLCFLIAVASGVVLLYTRTHNPASDGILQSTNKLYHFQFICTQVLCFLISVVSGVVFSTQEPTIQHPMRHCISCIYFSSSARRCSASWSRWPGQLSSWITARMNPRYSLSSETTCAASLATPTTSTPPSCSGWCKNPWVSPFNSSQDIYKTVWSIFLNIHNSSQLTINLPVFKITTNEQNYL